MLAFHVLGTMYLLSEWYDLDFQGSRCCQIRPQPSTSPSTTTKTFGGRIPKVGRCLTRCIAREEGVTYREPGVMINSELTLYKGLDAIQLKQATGQGRCIASHSD